MTRHVQLCLSPILFFALALSACGPHSLELNVLHTNDIHANYGGLTPDGKPCYEALCSGGEGGLVRMDREIAVKRAKGGNLVLLDAGDHFTGTLFHSRYKGKTTSAMLDFLAYDAAVPGNHEFDEGTNAFIEYVQHTRTPILAANLTLSGLKLAPWRIIKRDGVRIGIIGLTTPETAIRPYINSSTNFENEETALRRAVGELEAQGITHIVLLSHAGLARDKELAAQVNGVDLIVGGHSHSFLTSLPNEDPKKVDGPYPVVARSPSGKPVLIVTARHSGRLLGDITVRFDADGVPLVWSGEPIRLTGDTNVRPEAVALVEGFAKPLREWTAVPFGEILAPGFAEGTLLEQPDVFISRKQECATGNVLADILRSASSPDNKPIQIVLLNSGSLRQSLPAGKIRVSDLLATLPYENSLTMVDMPGSILVAALEHSVSTWENSKGRFLQVSGVKFTFDPKKQAGSRVLSASLVADGRVTPIDPKKIYRVATFAYVASGGDDFDMFKRLPWTPVASALALIQDKLAEKPFTARIDGRITIK